MFKVALAGANGKMGVEISSLLSLSTKLQCVAKIVESEQDCKDSNHYTSLEDAIASVGTIDILIDFTSASASIKFAHACAAFGIAHICGSTGFTHQQMLELQDLAKKALIFLSPNMSFGVAVLNMLCKKAASILDDSFDAEVLEMHHNKKMDAPSGTALMLGKSIADARSTDESAFVLNRNTAGQRKQGEIGFATIRGGSVVGEHTAFFVSETEKISLNHTSFTKRIYAEGALKAAIWIMGKAPGQIYSMDDIVSF